MRYVACCVGTGGTSAVRSRAVHGGTARQRVYAWAMAASRPPRPCAYVRCLAVGSAAAGDAMERLPSRRARGDGLCMGQ